MIFVTCYVLLSICYSLSDICYLKLGTSCKNLIYFAPVVWLALVICDKGHFAEFRDIFFTLISLVILTQIKKNQNS